MGKKALIAMRRKKMSMVFQSFALLPHKTVVENTAFGLEICGYDRRRQRVQAVKALETVGLQLLPGSGRGRRLLLAHAAAYRRPAEGHVR